MVMSVAVTVIVVVMSLLLLLVVGAKPVKGIVAIAFTVAAFLVVIGVATFVDAIVIKGVMTFDGVVGSISAALSCLVYPPREELSW